MTNMLGLHICGGLSVLGFMCPRAIGVLCGFRLESFFCLRLVAVVELSVL